MKPETLIRKAERESPDFGRYARYMLEEVPDIPMAMLRECYKHNASASEYRASFKAIRAQGGE